MLGFLPGSKVDHPMADAKRAREIVAELPVDSLKALAEITHWLESLREAQVFRADRLFDNIALLDGAARSHQRKLSQDYFSTSRQQKFQENRLWTCVHAYWKALSDGYLDCVSGFESGQTGGMAFRSNLPVIVARTLRALTLQLKWVLVRYGAVEPRLWKEIGRLYQFAESAGFLDSLVDIYPGNHDGGTVRQEFLRAMLLGVSATDMLRPVHQEIAERLVAHFSPGFRMKSEPGPGCGYCFDVTAGKPPQRTVGESSGQGVMRYFGAGDAYQQLLALEAKIAESGGIPENVRLSGSYDKLAVLPVLRHLAAYWSDDVPARSAERRKTATRVTVLHGLNEILMTLNPARHDELDFSDGDAAESWIIENVSAGGYGAIIPATRGDWVRVGALIGVRGETENRWSVGIVRRVTRDEHQQRRVGVQLISRTVIPAELGRSAGISNPGAGASPESALLLSASPDSRGEIALLLREGAYNSRDSLDMSVNGKPYLLMPVRLTEGGEDFDWARFQVMARSD